MYKYFLLAAIVLTGFLMFEINSGRIGADMIVAISAEESGDEELKSEESTEQEELESAPDDKLYGAILNSYTWEKWREYFENLSEEQTISTIVVLGKNSDNSGKYRIAFSKEDSGDILTENLLISLLADEEGSFGYAYSPFDNEKEFMEMVSNLRTQFPLINVVPVLISDYAKKTDLQNFGEVLADELSDEAIVICATPFSYKLDEQSKKFHRELSRNILENFEIENLKQLDVRGRMALYGLLQYLKNKEAELPFITDEYVNFYDGDSEGEDRDVTIMAFGDMMLGRYVRTLMNQNGKDYIFENIRGEDNNFFKGADIIFANLEGPINGEGTSGGTSMVFSFNEDIAPLLKKYGFNLLSLANNHAVDQGWNGRDNTVRAMQNSGLGWCGHPSEPDENSVYYKDIGEKKLGFICLHDVTFKLDDEKALELIESVRPEVDYLVVTIHWGYEYSHTPNFAAQIKPGRAFIDSGADIVIGHHPHVVQSFEVYKGKFIFYSLGNFVFDQYWSTETQEQLAIGIVLDDADDDDENLKTKIYLFPMKSEMSQPRLLSGEEYDTWISEFISYGDYSEEMRKMIKDGVLE